jgi:hypothetical protein
MMGVLSLLRFGFIRRVLIYAVFLFSPLGTFLNASFDLALWVGFQHFGSCGLLYFVKNLYFI